MLRPTPRPPPRDASEGDLQLELLLDLGAMLAREVELDDLLVTVGERVARAMRADRATLWLVDAATGELRSRVANLPELDELRIAIGSGVAGHVARAGAVINIADAASDARWAPDIDQRTGYHTRSMLCVPLSDAGSRLRGVMQVLNKHDGAFTDRDESFLRALNAQIVRALDYTTLRADDRPRGVPMRGRFNHIVGSSPVMQRVYDKVVRAAGTDATVLLHGETGTGKGIFARAIHVNSDRRSGPLVCVDCTNLPANLVESELFGHERGAYTSADARVLGKVEMAGGGTLFLDEIGELPLELQGKLLRFLQDRQFERVGGRETLEADVRIVVATNRELSALVERGAFRSDLYYRIRVIDIELPPLRERGRDDVLALADHFAAVYCRRYRKAPMPLTARARDAIASRQWPGNVRQLEHAIERAIVLGDANIDADAMTQDGLVARQHDAPVGADASAVAIPHALPLETAIARYVAAPLERAAGNRSAAARDLEISRNRLARIVANATKVE